MGMHRHNKNITETKQVAQVISIEVLFVSNEYRDNNKHYIDPSLSLLQ